MGLLREMQFFQGVARGVFGVAGVAAAILTVLSLSSKKRLGGVIRSCRIIERFSETRTAPGLSSGPLPGGDGITGTIQVDVGLSYVNS